MMAIIMAGGKGSRLKPYTMSIPKPLLPLGETPIIEVILKQLRYSGVKDVIISLGHMAPFFEMVLGKGDRFGLNIEYVIEEMPLGTAGALKLMNNLNEDFIVMNGDVLTTLDIREFMKLHIYSNSVASIAVHKRTVNIDYGVVEYDKNQMLSNYTEKPAIHYEVSMGINILNKSVLKHIPFMKRFDIPDLMKALKDSGEKIYCYSTDCYWQDIGRFDDYQKASEDYVHDPSLFI